jgi:hypothetical protein
LQASKRTLRLPIGLAHIQEDLHTSKRSCRVPRGLADFQEVLQTSNRTCRLPRGLADFQEVLKTSNRTCRLPRRLADFQEISLSPVCRSTSKKRLPIPLKTKFPSIHPSPSRHFPSTSSIKILKAPKSTIKEQQISFESKTIL